MLNMKKLIVLLVASMICMQAFSADDSTVKIAKVEFSKIRDLLMERVLKKSKDSELKKKYEEKQQKKKAQMKAIMAAHKKGNFNPMDFAADFASDIAGGRNKDVENLAKGELILIIEKIYPKQYKFIYNESYGDSVLFTELAIPDITDNIKQFLLKEKIKSETK